MNESQVDKTTLALLRAGDPAAADSGLSPARKAAMRSRILAAGRERQHRSHGWLVPATTVATLLVVALGMAWRSPRALSPLRTAALAPPTPASAAADHSGQQVQFTTENGTLVVWVLQPKSTT